MCHINPQPSHFSYKILQKAFRRENKNILTKKEITQFECNLFWAHLHTCGANTRTLLYNNNSLSATTSTTECVEKKPRQEMKT